MSCAGPCPKCFLVLEWSVKKCGRCGLDVQKKCPVCRAETWSWWSTCPHCKQNLQPPQGKKLMQFSDKPFDGKGPCPNCWSEQSWYDKQCGCCQKQLEKRCKCGEVCWPWWHKCRACGAQNNWTVG